MNEKDTYLRLKRIPFEEMREIYNAWYKSAPSLVYLYDNKSFILEQYGWTEDDFQDAHNRNGTFM